MARGITCVCKLLKKDFLQYLAWGGIFYQNKELSKSNQILHRVCPVHVECGPKEFFSITRLGKKLGISTEFLDVREKQILKINIFHLTKELSK